MQELFLAVLLRSLLAEETLTLGKGSTIKEETAESFGAADLLSRFRPFLLRTARTVLPRMRRMNRYPKGIFSSFTPTPNQQRKAGKAAAN